jgi:hypothetical protein
MGGIGVMLDWGYLIIAAIVFYLLGVFIGSSLK